MLTGYKAGDAIILSSDGSGLPIVETEPPTAMEGYEAKPHWAESRDSIVQVWEIVPVAGSPEEASVNLARLQFMSLPDSAAYEFRALAELWIAGATYYGPDDPSGMPQSRVLFNSRLFKCLTTHNSQLDWTPVNAPSLWAEILPGQEGNEPEEGYAEWVQPESTNGYQKGDRVTHAGHLWESAYDGDNVWEPGAVGAPWKDLGEYPPAEGEE